MPLFQREFGDSLLKNAQTPSVLESVVTVTGDTTPTSSTHDIVAAKFSVVNSIGTDPETENLILYWNLDEVSGDSGDLVSDSSGYNKNGKIYGDPVFRDATVNNGIYLDGVDDYLQYYGNISAMDTADGWSISLWINLAEGDSQTVGWARLFTYGRSTGNEVIDFYVNNTGTLLRFRHFDGGADSGVQNANNVQSYPVFDGQEHNVIITYETGGTQKVYIDGKLGDSRSGYFDYDISDGFNFLNLGSTLSGTGELTGLFDEVRIYDKTLTADNALFLYSNPPGSTTTAQHPVGSANVNPVEVAGGGIVFNELSAAPTTGGLNKGILYLKDTGLYFVDQDGHDVPAASYEGGTWFDIEGDSGIWHQGPVIVGDSQIDYRVAASVPDFQVRGKLHSTTFWATKLGDSSGYGYIIEEVSANTGRYGLKYGSAGNIGDTNLMALTNRAAGGEISLQVNSGVAGPSGETEAIRLKYDSGIKVGINTTTIPHSAVGMAMLALNGSDGDSNGPHVQYTVDVDNYPVFQQLNWTHDNISLNFDSYWDGGWKSGDAGSNFQIYKASDKLQIRYDSAINPGDTITWNSGMVITADGLVGIRNDSPDKYLSFYNNAFGIDSDASFNFALLSNAYHNGSVWKTSGTSYGSDAGALFINGDGLDFSVYAGVAADETITWDQILVANATGLGVGTSPGNRISVYDATGTCYVDIKSGAAENAGIRLGNTAGEWVPHITSGGNYAIYDSSSTTNPFYIENNSPSYMLFLNSDGEVLINASGPYVIEASSTYFSGETPRFEIITGTSGSVAYEEFMELRHTGIDVTARTRRLGLLFKHSTESTAGESQKMSGIMSESLLGWAGNPDMHFLTENAIRMTILHEGYVGIGATTITRAGLQVDTIVGNTNAQFGSTNPLFIVSNSPNIGFNAYYNTEWRTGTGVKYASTMGFDSNAGTLSIATSTGTAATDAAVSGMTTALTISNAQDITVSNGQLLITDGSLSAPGIAFSSSTNSGIMYNSPNMQFTLAGTMVIFMTSAGFYPGDDGISFYLGAASYRWKEVRAIDLYGTIQTAAQTNITSLGTLTSLTTSGDIICGGELTVNGTTRTAGYFYKGTTEPTGTTRMNYDGYFYPHYINLLGSSDTTTVPTHVFIETGTDGYVRPQTLAVFAAHIDGNIDHDNLAGVDTNRHRQIFVQTGTPSSPATGDLWIDTT